MFGLVIKRPWGVVIASSLIAASALAESQADIAAKENEAGKDLMFAGKYAEASAKFQDAVARVPEAKYFFNLCTSRYQEGKFGEALTACNSADKNGADDKLRDKTAKLEQRIRDEAKAQGIDLQLAGGGGGETNVGQTDPNATTTTATPPDGAASTGTTLPPDGTAGTTGTTAAATVGTPPGQPVYAVGRPPNQGLFVAVPPSHSYVWTLGVDLFGGGGRFGGQLNGADVYGNAVEGLRLKSDYLFDPTHKVGTQLYLQISNFTANQMQTMAVSSLQVLDVGLALYKHFCQGSGHFCVTPLLGAQLSLLSPNQTASNGSTVFSYTAAGARAELAASYAFGRHFEHVLSAMIGANAYIGVFTSPSDCALTMTCASNLGLDTGGAYAYLGLGYTFRFSTPLGRAPFVTLE
jgi:hypothetical protein